MYDDLWISSSTHRVKALTSRISIFIHEAIRLRFSCVKLVQKSLHRDCESPIDDTTAKNWIVKETETYDTAKHE